MHYVFQKSIIHKKNYLILKTNFFRNFLNEKNNSFKFKYKKFLNLILPLRNKKKSFVKKFDLIIIPIFLRNRFFLIKINCLKKEIHIFEIIPRNFESKKFNEISILVKFLLTFFKQENKFLNEKIEIWKVLQFYLNNIDKKIEGLLMCTLVYFIYKKQDVNITKENLKKIKKKIVFLFEHLENKN